LEIVFGSIFDIYNSTPILCCTTGVGGGGANEQFWFGENLGNIRGNLGKFSENLQKIPENFCKRL